MISTARFVLPTPRYCSRVLPCHADLPDCATPSTCSSQGAARKLPFLRDSPKLTKKQAQTSQARAAKALGAAAGVTLGCIIGLIPLFLQGNFFVQR